MPPCAFVSELLFCKPLVSILKVNPIDSCCRYEDGYVTGSRQCEFAILKDHVLNKEENAFHRAVISILGESGIGKTTLAKRVYHHPDIMKHFEVHAWVCLPPHIRFEDYVEIIYRQVSLQVPEAPGKVVAFLLDDEETTNKEHN
jgi:disease resistance protein RPM1